MEQKSVLIEIPASLFERIQKAAAESDQPIETVVANSLAVLFGEIPEDPDAMLQALKHYTDDQLWAVIYQRMPQSEESRLDELVAKAKRSALPMAEQTELEALLERVNLYTLLRTQVLFQLQERGYDVEDRYKLKV